MIKENTNLDSFSDESDILTEDNSLQYKNQHLENTEERIHENFNDDLYSQNENIASEDLENRPPPEPPPAEKDLPAIKLTTNRNIIECRDQLTMRKDNYAYFISTKNEPRDNDSKILLKRNELPQFKNLCVGHAQEFRRGSQYHLALPIESEIKENLSDTLKNIRLTIYSLYS